MFSLEAITPTQRTALVQAWMVYHGIPDYSTLRFISRLTELDLNLVRYWFHCRVNCDGIMHAIANTAPGGDKAVDLPAAEDYHELEKFSSALEEYREQERQQQARHNHEAQAQESCVSSSRHNYKTAPRSPAEMSRNVPSKNSQRSAGIRSLITPPGSNGDDVRPKVQRIVRAQKAVAVGTRGAGAQKLSCIHTPVVSQVSLPTDKDQATKQYRGRMRTGKEEMAIESTTRTSEDDVGQTEEDDKSSKKKGGRRPKNQPPIAKRPLILNESDDYEEETDTNKKHEIEGLKGRNSFIIKTPPSSGVEDTTVMGSTKKTSLTGRRSADASKPLSSMVVDENENTIVQAEKDATGMDESKFLKRSDARESKPFDLSTGIIGDDMDHCQGLINDQVQLSWKVDMIQGHETGTSFKRAQQTKALGRSKSKKAGPSISADQETVNPNETRQDDRVLVETLSGQAAGTVAAQERGQRMFLVAVELKERRSERRNDDTEEHASMHGTAAEQLRPAAQKRLPRGQPLLNINKPSMVHASKAEMKQLTTTPTIISPEIPQADDGTGKTRRVITQLKRQSSAFSPTEKKAFVGDQHIMIESGDITLSTAESPDEQSGCEPTTGGSQPATGIISEKMDAMLGKISWRDQFAAIKVKKKPKPPNLHTMGEEVSSHFQSSYNTSAILTHISVSMPMETSGLSSPHGGSSHGYSPFYSMNHEHEHDQIQDYEHGWDRERSRETSRVRERSRGHDHDRGRSRDSRDSRRERGQVRGRDRHRDRADREHEYSRRHGDRNRDGERQSRSKNHRVDDRGEGRSRMNTRDEDGYGYGERAHGQHDGDWGGWSHTDHFSPIRDRPPSEIQSPHETRPSRVPSPFEVQSPKVQSPEVQSQPRIQSPPEVQSPPKAQSPSPDTEPLPMICISSDIRSPSKVSSVMMNPKRIRKDKLVDTESSKRRRVSDTRMTSGTMVDLPDFHPHDYLRGELSE
ncbi:hypothetical protein BGX34_003704 [Mortierella sp. NVP85]|nr:hypothetical protein BGX34_003704 [Mortierella sp. NVP85]